MLKIDKDNRSGFYSGKYGDWLDAAIEFTAPDSAYKNVISCIDFGVPVVSGSTGWNHNLEEMKRYCQEKRRRVFCMHSNFSIGREYLF